MHKYLLFLSLFSGSLSLLAQQTIFVGGNDNGAASKGNPEIFVDDGPNGFLFIEGGVSANNAASGGVGTGTADIRVDGAIFIGNQSPGVPGNVVNSTDKPMVFDYDNAAITPASAAAVSGTLPTLTAAPDGVNTRGGTVHLMDGTQDFIGNAAPDDDIIFYNLSLEGNLQSKNMVNVNVQTGVKGADATAGANSGTNSNGTLFLHNNTLNTNDNVAWVRNPSNVNTMAMPTSGMAITREDGGDGFAGAVGMVSQHQYHDLTYGMVVSTGNGRLAREVNTTGDYLFPVGNGTYYRPVDINTNQNGTYYARLEVLTPNTTSAGVPAPIAINPYFYWRLNSSFPSAQPQLRLYAEVPDLTLSSCPTPAILSNLGIAQSEGTTPSTYDTWTDDPAVGGGPNTGDLVYATTSSYNTFGAPMPTMIGDPKESYSLDHVPAASTVGGLPCGPFPTELLNFNGYYTGIVNYLYWFTASETNSDYFALEKSTDNFLFQELGKVDAAGNSSSIRNYDFIDNQPSPINFYRLRMVDLNGGMSYSNTVEIRISEMPVSASVFPNPFADELEVQISGMKGTVKFRLYNELGQEVYSANWKADGSAIFQTIDLSTLAKGMYVYRIIDNENVLDGKVIKAQ